MPGKRRDPPRGQEIPVPVRQQCAPVGRRRLRAEAEERQSCRLHHHRAGLQRGQHQHRGEAVRQHMAQHHAQSPRADRARRHDEIGGLHRQHLAAHQPGVLRRIDDADRDHRVGQARPEYRDDDQRQQQIGKRQQHIDHAHDQCVHPSADIARHQPERCRPAAAPGRPPSRSPAVPCACRRGCGSACRGRTGRRRTSAARTAATSALDRSCSYGSNGATSGANTVSARNTTAIARPNRAPVPMQRTADHAGGRLRWWRS